MRARQVRKSVRRTTLATEIMRAAIAREGSAIVYLNATRYARDAVGIADALLAELDERGTEKPAVSPGGVMEGKFILPPEAER
jgi:hypothetical protein